MQDEIGQLGRVGKHSALVLENNPIVFGDPAFWYVTEKKNSEPAECVDEPGNGHTNQNASQRALISNHYYYSTW